MDAPSIRILRQRLGLTQRALADELGVTSATVGNWERGASRPEPATMKRLQALSAEVGGLPDVNGFRPVQYLGSKARLASQICGLLAELAPNRGRVADLYSGSAVVSSALSRLRPVGAVDIQAYAADLASGILLGKARRLEQVATPNFQRAVLDRVRKFGRVFEPLCSFESDAIKMARQGEASALAAIIDSGSIAAFEAAPRADDNKITDLFSSCSAEIDPSQRKALTATIHFGGVYFAYSQAIVLDAIAAVISELPKADRPLLRAVLSSTASNIVATVGKQFAQPMRLIKRDGHTQMLLLQRAIADRTSDVLSTYTLWANRWSDALKQRSSDDNQVVCGDAAASIFALRDITAFYADPPYTIDHYSRFYHVLETLTLRDDPPLALDNAGNVMRGLYRSDRYQSPFCIPSLVESAFSGLFETIAGTGRPLLLSYSPYKSSSDERPRLLTVNELRALALNYFSSVEVLEANAHAHRKLNARDLNTPISISAELFIVCRDSRG